MKKNCCTFSLDRIPFTKYYWGDCCGWHDIEYKRNPKIMTRKEADFIFYNMLKERMPFVLMAYIYYLGVRSFCYPSWNRWKYYWLFTFIPIYKFWKRKND